MASIGLPGLANFAGEFLVFLSGFKGWVPEEGFGPVQVATILALWGLVISAVYMLRAYRQTFQGEPVDATSETGDLGLTEKLPAALLALALLIVGLYPNALLSFMQDENARPSPVARTPITPLQFPDKSPSPSSKLQSPRFA